MAKAKSGASPRAAKKRKISESPRSKGKSKQLIEEIESEDEFDKLLDDADGFDEALDIAARKPAVEDDQPWGRPILKPLNKQEDKITFQQIDIEEYTEPGQPPTLRIYGVTEEGHSVLAHIIDFMPYLYVSAPRGFQNTDCEPFKAHLNGIIQGGQKPVHSVTIANKRSLWGYKGDDVSPFIKVTITDQRLMAKTRNAFEKGEVNFKGLWPAEGCTTYESNIAYTLRFMIDLKIVGMGWMEIAERTYKVRPHSERISTCQIEVDCSCVAAHSSFDAHSSTALTAHAPDGEWQKMAPLRVLSFDIECAGRKGIFPEPNIDPIIQIANMVTRHGETKPFVRNVFVLDDCAPIVGTQVLGFSSEKEMLLKWRKFVEEVDPDVIIGYNTSNFDLPYLLDRAKHLKAGDFPFLSRLRRMKTDYKDAHFSSKAYGTRDTKETRMDGRVQFDLLQVIQRDFKLRSYSLNSVCAQFLGEQKEDVHHSIITDLHNGSAESRRRLAVYCLKDAYLPQRLLDKLMLFVNYSEMARVTGVPFNYLLSRGQAIKVMSQLFRKAGDDGYLIPSFKVEGSDEQYEGATVLEPVQGYYDVPIATLDFASLYPSIMQAHNLCYTTLLMPEVKDRLNLVKDVDYILTPNNDMFVTAERRKGLVPEVLKDLLAARKRARADLKVEKDPFRRAVLDGRQLALKISANSVYGFTGATTGKLPCLPISMSTTAFGRQMIERTKQEVEDKYTTANGYEADAEVIYGDTDSVMVKFGCRDLKTAMELGAEAANFVTEKFVKPIKLEFEKVYFPYLLINKKRYAGLYWTKPDKWDKMDTKGIETVRRDNCRLVVTVIETCLKKMLIERDVKGAEEYTKRIIADLLQNRVDLSQLVITKALAKADYANVQAHVELAKRMKERDAGSAPALGDRVAFVIIKGTKDARAYEKSEDPLYVLEHNLPIDTKYYLDNQLSKPLMRIFEPILGEKASSLLAGDHTRSVSITAPTKGGLMGFVKKTETCLGCKTPLGANNKSGTNTAVCINCKKKGLTSELYAKHLGIAAEYEQAFNRLWTQCQRCQGSLHQDVLCTSKDCPIYYMRIRSRKDLADSTNLLTRFDGTW